jgi:hypothetical protein
MTTTTTTTITNIPMDVCSFIEDENKDLSELLESSNIEDDPITLYISRLLERLTKEMIIKRKSSDKVNIILPNWFKSLEPKYQKILFTILEPILKDCLHNS